MVGCIENFLFENFYFYENSYCKLRKLGIYKKIALKYPIFLEIWDVAKTKISIYPRK